MDITLAAPSGIDRSLLAKAAIKPRTKNNIVGARRLPAMAVNESSITVS
jgi:hypothetical protein